MGLGLGFYRAPEQAYCLPPYPEPEPEPEPRAPSPSFRPGPNPKQAYCLPP